MFRRNYVFSGILVVSMLFLSMLLVIPRASAWQADISIDDLNPSTSVNTIYVNNTTTLTNTFAVIVHNIGSQPMEITWLGLHFDWDPPLQSGMGGIWWGTWINQEQIVDSGATYEDDYVFVEVPAGVSIGYHTVTVGISVADPAAGSSWGTPTNSYFNDTVYVAFEPAVYPPPSNHSPQSPFPAILLVIAVIAAVAVVFFAVDRHRKNLARAASGQAVSVNAPSERMYCQNCGSVLLANHPFCPNCGKKGI